MLSNFLFYFRFLWIENKSKKKSLKHKLKNVWYYSRYHGTCKDGNYYLKKKEVYRLNLTNNALKSIIPKEWFV